MFQGHLQLSRIYRIFGVMSGQDFKLNEKIVYPSQGVGVITAIEQREFKGGKILYYVIYIEVTDMTVLVPVEKAAELGLRAIVEVAEAERALEVIGEDFEPNPSDWKLRYQMNMDLLRKGTVTDIAAIVRSLYHRSKIKELPIMERKLYESALKLFEDELSYSLHKTKEEIEGMIFQKLEKEHEKKEAAKREARELRETEEVEEAAATAAEEGEEDEEDDDD
jgi:CarD family transcriptional regulator